MENEDSTKALFSEPNAYIQSCVRPKPKKAVFAEPYENLPPFYINNNFKAGDCGVNCGCDCGCNHLKQNCGCNKNQNFGGGLNLNSILPIVSTLLGKNSNISTFMPLIKAFSSGGNVDLTKLLTTILSNKDALNGFANMFNKNKTQKQKKEIPNTEFPIENYTKVEED